MVRMVYRNNFYEMGWGISYEKKELWTKSKILEGRILENLRGSNFGQSAGSILATICGGRIWIFAFALKFRALFWFSARFF